MNNECDCGENCSTCEACNSPMCECYCDYESDDSDETEQDW